MNKDMAAKIILDMVKNIGDVAKLLNPETVHITMYCLNGNADFTLYAGENEEERLSGHYFGSDGSVRINDKYDWKEVSE